jgi:hypothetical protein
MMITHHQGAIRMARAELNKGGNAELRAIARAIVSAQKGEITEMNRWRKQWYGGTSPSGGIRPADVDGLGSGRDVRRPAVRPRGAAPRNTRTVALRGVRSAGPHPALVCAGCVR